MEKILSMKILVAGDAGFIRTHLTDVLLKNIHKERKKFIKFRSNRKILKGNYE